MKSSSLRIALAQINPTIGDLGGNTELIVRTAERARDRGAQLVVFPELALTAYGPCDLLERPAFLRAIEQHIELLIKNLPAEITCIVGAPVPRPKGASRGLYNSALVIEGRSLRAAVHKQLLPNYDVFDDERWFERGPKSAPIEIAGVRVGITICEDAWNYAPILPSRAYPCDPVGNLINQGAELLINLSGSPFTRAKRLGRGAMLAEIAKRSRTPLVLVNQVGAHDDLVYDGASMLLGPDGSVWARARVFEEDLVISEVAAGGSVAAWPETEEDAVIDALVLGIRDYCRRCGLSRAILGLSGGIDSAVVATLASMALGSDSVIGVAMPSRYSSEGSVTDAKSLASALGIAFELVPIETIFDPYEDLLREPLARVAKEVPDTDVTFENIQARLRMTILMALGNRSGALLLATGNKSEIACGYGTLYGDMAGGLAVISDLYKTFVYRVARALNRRLPSSPIPESTLTKAPSAELRPGQKDEDSLPPYSVLDAILERHIEGQLDRDGLILEGFEEAVVDKVIHLVRISEHKRRQLAPGLVVSSKAFGPGRRIPIARK